MTSRRRLAAAAGALVVLLLLGVLFLPALLRGPIEDRLRQEVNRGVKARVAWGAIGLDGWRAFPNVTLTVADLSVAGIGVFAGDTLLALPCARLVLDLRSVVQAWLRGAPIVVRAIDLQRPRVVLRVLADGTANWEISRTTDTLPRAADSRGLRITLRHFAIDGGAVTLHDARSTLEASITGLEERLDGDFARERFVLTTRTRADSVSVRFAGIPWLSSARVELLADIDADLPAHRFTFRDDTLRINALTLAFAGAVTTGDPDLGLDISFETPSTAFQDLLSLVPAIYARDFASIRTSGTMSVSGRARGRLGPDAFPAIAVRARADGGAFRYPSLPLGARDIAFDLRVDNPGGHRDSTVISLDRLHAVIGTHPVDARLTLRTPISDPDVDLRVLGTIDLGELARTIPLEGVRSLAGTVRADVALRTRLSSIDARQYERVEASGALYARAISVTPADSGRTVAIDTAAIVFTPRAAEVRTLAARVGSSDFRVTGAVEHLLAYALRGDDLRGSGTVTSRVIDMADLISTEPMTRAVVIPPRVHFTLDAAADRVTHGAITASQARANVVIRDQRATLTDLRLTTLGGQLSASGFYETLDPTRPTFDVAFGLDSLDLPTAFRAVNTVRTLAPVAQWARGSVSGTVALRGSMDSLMAPVFAALTGDGLVGTQQLALEGVPILGRLADALSLEALRNPSIGAQQLGFTVRDGRVIVQPMTVRMGDIALTASGSHGIDQTLSYDMALAVPRSLLVGPAAGAVSGIMRRAGRRESDLDAGDVAQLRAQVVGTVTSPRVTVDFAGMARSVAEAARTAVVEQVEQRVEQVKAAVDSTADAALRRAREEGARIVAEAERQADTIRAEARRLAEAARAAAALRADSLVERANGPVAKAAARVAADRVLRGADQQADRLVSEADARAEALVVRARQQAAALIPPGG